MSQFGTQEYDNLRKPNMFVNNAKIRFLLACSFLTSSAATAADYYVATDGRDSNPGSKTHPFRTIQKAADRMQPGDTCYLRAGVYRQTARLNRSGLPQKPESCKGPGGLGGACRKPGGVALHHQLCIL